MEDKGRGIIIRTVKYGDNGLVVTLLSRTQGLISLFVRSVGGKKSKFKPAILQRMNIVDYVISGRVSENRTSYLKEISMAHIYKEIPFDIKKSSIVFYMCDLLAGCINGNESDSNLYDFVEQTLLWLDLVDSGYANLPVYFTLELSRQLGFYPNTKSYTPESFFDMEDGEFKPQKPSHTLHFDQPTSTTLHRLCHTPLAEIGNLGLTNTQRRNLLDGLLDYYAVHMSGMRKPESHEVLREILG